MLSWIVWMALAQATPTPRPPVPEVAQPNPFRRPQFYQQSLTRVAGWYGVAPEVFEARLLAVIENHYRSEGFIHTPDIGALDHIFSAATRGAVTEHATTVAMKTHRTGATAREMVEDLVSFADLPRSFDLWEWQDQMIAVTLFGERYDASDRELLAKAIRIGPLDDQTFEITESARRLILQHPVGADLWATLVDEAGATAAFKAKGIVFPKLLTRPLPSQMKQFMNPDQPGVQLNGLTNKYAALVGKTLRETDFPLKVSHRTRSAASAQVIAKRQAFASMGKESVLGGHASWGEGLYAAVDPTLVKYGPFSVEYDLNPDAVLGRDLDVFRGQTDGWVVVAKTQNAFVNARLAQGFHGPIPFQEPLINHVMWARDRASTLSVEELNHYVAGVLRAVIDQQIPSTPVHVLVFRNLTEKNMHEKSSAWEAGWEEAMAPRPANEASPPSVVALLDTLGGDEHFQELRHLDDPKVVAYLRGHAFEFPYAPAQLIYDRHGVMSFAIVEYGLLRYRNQLQSLEVAGKLPEELLQSFKHRLVERKSTLDKLIQEWLLQVLQRNQPRELAAAFERLFAYRQDPSLPQSAREVAADVLRSLRRPLRRWQMNYLKRLAQVDSNIPLRFPNTHLDTHTQNMLLSYNFRTLEADPHDAPQTLLRARQEELLQTILGNPHAGDDLSQVVREIATKLCGRSPQ